MALGFVAGIALSILTEGAAMPVTLTLMATVAGDAAIGAGAELATEAIDGQRINWGQVGLAAGMSAGATLAGFGLGRLSKLKGTSNRPFGGLMMEGTTSDTRDFAARRISELPQGGVYILGVTTRPNSSGSITRELALAYWGKENHLDIIINMSNREGREAHVDIDGLTWEGKRLYKELRANIPNIEDTRSFSLLGRNTSAAANSFVKLAKKPVITYGSGGFYTHANERSLYSNILCPAVAKFDAEGAKAASEFLNSRLSQISYANGRIMNLGGFHDDDVSMALPRNS